MGDPRDGLRKSSLRRPAPWHESRTMSSDRCVSARGCPQRKDRGEKRTSYLGSRSVFFYPDLATCVKTFHIIDIIVNKYFFHFLGLLTRGAASQPLLFFFFFLRRVSCSTCCVS